MEKIEFDSKEIENEIEIAEGLFEESLKDEILPVEESEKILKILKKVHHEFVKLFETPDPSKTSHMREFIFDYERAIEHKGTADGTTHLKKCLKTAGLVLKDIIEEKKRRDNMAEIIRKRTAIKSFK